jgi:hypothetical protein
MDSSAVLEALRGYRTELAGILSRFSRTRERIAIQVNDGFRFRRLVTEVVDLLRDHVPGSAAHIGIPLWVNNRHSPE